MIMIVMIINLITISRQCRKTLFNGYRKHFLRGWSWILTSIFRLG